LKKLGVEWCGAVRKIRLDMLCSMHTGMPRGAY
jgi:hypothetical protein